MWFRRKNREQHSTPQDCCYSQSLETLGGTIVREYAGAAVGNFRWNARTSYLVSFRPNDEKQGWTFTLDNAVEPHQPWNEPTNLFVWKSRVLCACGEHTVLLDLNDGSVIWDLVLGNTAIDSMYLDEDLYLLHD